jgi:serine/threonine-protein kinase RsbW
MGKRFSEPARNPLKGGRIRQPKVFLIASDEAFLDRFLSECRDTPKEFERFTSVTQLMDNLAVAIVAEREGARVDVPALRLCRLNHPEILFFLVLEEVDQRTSQRLQSLGVQNILLPPFDRVSLTREIETAVPNIPQFKRHPDLLRRGEMRLDFLIPSDLSYVLGLNYLISMLLKEFAFPLPDSRINIPLACDEAVTNAIVHGNRQDPNKKVNIQIYISHSRFRMRIRDEGEGFDVDALADPTAEENLLRTSGRGIFLMRNIMDSVVFKEGGRVVELEKRNPNAEPR